MLLLLWLIYESFFSLVEHGPMADLLHDDITRHHSDYALVIAYQSIIGSAAKIDRVWAWHGL